MARNVIPLTNLIEQFERMPGIGHKSAQKLAFYILGMSDDEVKRFAENIILAKQKIHHCKVCCDLTDSDICSICSEYNGLYHVLHGSISPMNGIGPDEITIKELLSRLSDENIKEIIMATNPTVEGEATAMYISRLIKPMGIKVSRLAYGVPVGADLEYADEITLTRALEGRQIL